MESFKLKLRDCFNFGKKGKCKKKKIKNPNARYEEDDDFTGNSNQWDKDGTCPDKANGSILFSSLTGQFLRRFMKKIKTF